MRKLAMGFALCVVTSVGAIPAVGATEAGELYDNFCAACHNLGVAGAPRITDQQAWKPRIARGNKVLYDHAINGFVGENGSMPPKGGFVDLTDEDVKVIVEYMVSRVK